MTVLSDNIDFRENKITRNKEGHHINIKGEIQQEDIIIINMIALETKFQNK